MRRAYIESTIPLPEAVGIALGWARKPITIHVPNTGAVEANPWLTRLGVPITSSSAKSRFQGTPRGTVLGFCLPIADILEVERVAGLDGLVAVRAYDPGNLIGSVPSHAQWITAFDVEHLGGEVITRTPEASPPLKAAVQALTGIAVANQGLLDSRERSEAVQALGYLRARGVVLEPDGLMVEALRNGWGGTGPEDLRAIAVDLNKGKKLRSEKRLSPETLERWLQQR